MTEQEQIEAKLSEAFHLMYDGLPEPVQLCHKTYRVVAVNPACESYGRKPGCDEQYRGQLQHPCYHNEEDDKHYTLEKSIRARPLYPVHKKVQKDRNY